MRVVFADSYYFFALLNLTDPTHSKAVDFADSYSGKIVTTGWILTELADGCARSAAGRSAFLQVHANLRGNPKVALVPCSDMLFNSGVELFAQRADKKWSLTDCTSFVIMQKQGIHEVLTGDHHFEQAGFVALLK